MARMSVQSVRRMIAAAVGGMLVCLGTCAAQEAPPADEPFTPVLAQPGKDVVWVPSPNETVELMLDVAGVTPDDVVIDLGSGDGRTVIAAAKRGARAIGVEYNPDMVAYSKREAARAGVGDRARFVQGDMYEADVSEATVLALFLLPENLRKLSPTFLALRPGTRIVANTFAIPGWVPEKTVERQDDCTSWCTVMLYLVPAQVDGVWEGQDHSVRFVQQAQDVGGELVDADGPRPLSDVRLSGAELSFSVGDVRYTGTVDGDTITGTRQDSSGATAPWQVRRPR
jgi:SAM-dependent methyltransferase